MAAAAQQINENNYILSRPGRRRPSLALNYLLCLLILLLRRGFKQGVALAVKEDDGGGSE
jgi:hypothetical protein